MAEKTVSIFHQQKKPIKILKCKLKVGKVVSIGYPLLIYDFVGAKKAEQRKLKSTQAGTVSLILVQENQVVQPGDLLLELEPCSHPTIMNDMCAECGADLRKNDDISTASVPMIHAIPDLKVSEELALKLGRADNERLLKDRKLVLLVDLDQTLIHTTNDNIPANIKDVYHFQLHGPHSPWYHTRLRPGTHKFLNNIHDYYELHICTFGARNYAHTIAMFLDADKNFFSNRILSRDECFDPTSKKANLKSLFPCGDNLVCIIDDREDVWSHASNLIHVKPYHFFKHTGDINAPPGLDKHENDKLDDGVDLSVVKVKDLDTDKQNNVASNIDKHENEKNIEIKDPDQNEQSNQKQENSTLSGHTKNKEDQEKIVESAEIEMGNGEPIKNNVDKDEDFQVSSKTEDSQESTLKEKDNVCLPTHKSTQEPKQVSDSSVKVDEDMKETDSKNDEINNKNDEIDNKKEETDTTVQCTNKTEETKNENPEPDKKNDNPESDKKNENDLKENANRPAESEHPKEELIEIDDPDDYLIYLEEILKQIHDEFFTEYDLLDSGEVPDLKQVIPKVRSNVLYGCNLVFSGLVPNHLRLEQSKAYQVARGLGANVTQDIEDVTTHLVAVRPGTAKVNSGRRKKKLKIVTPDWLWCCAERWEHVDERIFPLNSKGSKNRHPPPHCSSPQHIASYPEHGFPEMRKRTPSGKFIDTINPLMALSSDEIADMDKEVEDILDDESDSSEEETNKKDISEYQIIEDIRKNNHSDSSSSEDSLTAEYPRGYKRKKHDSTFDQDYFDHNSSEGEDESPSVKFRRGELIDDVLDFDQEDTQGSVDPPDDVDDGEWNMMGAALEREFLSNN